MYREVLCVVLAFEQSYSKFQPSFWNTVIIWGERSNKSEFVALNRTTSSGPLGLWQVVPCRSSGSAPSHLASCRCRRTASRPSGRSSRGRGCRSCSCSRGCCRPRPSSSPGTRSTPGPTLSWPYCTCRGPSSCWDKSLFWNEGKEKNSQGSSAKTAKAGGSVIVDVLQWLLQLVLSSAFSHSLIHSSSCYLMDLILEREGQTVTNCNVVLC